MPDFSWNGMANEIRRRQIPPAALLGQESTGSKKDGPSWSDVAAFWNVEAGFSTELALDGWATGIRTPIKRSRAVCPTIRRSPNGARIVAGACASVNSRAEIFSLTRAPTQKYNPPSRGEVLEWPNRAAC